MPTSLRQRRTALALTFITLASCADDTSTAASAPKQAVEVTRSFERDDSEGPRLLRLALDLGDLELAKDLLEEQEATLGVEAPMLAARLAALTGEDLEVMRLVELARTTAPSDPRVYAMAAELSAAAGRLETATSELQRGVEVAGLTPELLRAQGVIELCRQGRAQSGLELIERALEYDAGLPFTERARAQAHLLLGKRALSQSRPLAALEHATRSLEFDPKDIDARLFFVDILAATMDFVGAARVLEELRDEGFGRESELALMYKRAAMAELLEHRRDQALEYFRLAREAGLSSEELGSGAQILSDAAMEAMEAGIKAFSAGELETARLRFEHALRLDDDLLVAHNHLAVVLFQLKQFLPAATHWRHVLDTSLQEQVELPEPVHIFLSKALYAAGEKSAAREVLEDYLERAPQGEWRSQTGALLDEL